MVSDRAYLKGARVGAGLERLRAEVARLLDIFRSGGAVLVEPEALQPAEVLLDLYGEEIRARAFMASDDRGEMMLRPDFTVPIVRLHMDSGAEPARYAYCGPVWRKQEAGSKRAREYLQAGFEVFESGDPARSDAEVMALIARALDGAPVDFVTGDMGLVLAAIDALATNPARKAALRRHVWRPAKFHALLRRYGVEHAGLVERRAAMILARDEGRLPAMAAAAGPAIGLRTLEDIDWRAGRLAIEAATPALSAGEVDLLEAVLGVEAPSGAALDRYRDLSAGMPGLRAAVDRFAARLDALEAAGLDAAALPFQASFGRTALEYYDGFVFGAVAPGRPDLPAIANGGRYDALTRVLGRGRGIPAVGAIIRPEALVALTEGME
ncbi:ATP phosphoribosyltransferase regulatory subunit [Amaricoccus solimangrovi]|uniref:ATP phosphoribosyltransferase regulatory subunit n=1 Tax=Amaricoccus solimangrovi TaxID=2589815 RepID=A0A501WZG2_9RHOB|nr:ATP phosphoribosyltransferase regulatory subunit [Amaricoccus solimangrovi]TPE53137.1 ATP phosphoribosyltransferase regulatory subunit [Amaricoccus solimangrovi]